MRYLALRLPAEVTAPHKEYPRPTILSLASSYVHKDLPFPGNSPPSTGDLKKGSSPDKPRPRPLFIDKPLPILAKEDQLAYNAFVEGVALLAYNVTWACCTQGVSIGDRSTFEDVTNIGRNLYNLLVGNQQYDNTRGRIFSKATANDTKAEMGDTTKPTNLMGRNSHGTAHSPLNDEFIRNFKLPNPKSLADRLRSKLSSQGTMPEWEVLGEDEWEAEDHGAMEQGVLARGGSRNKQQPDMRLFGVESMATVRGALDESIINIPSPPSQRDRRSTGMNGWTKLKPR